MAAKVPRAMLKNGSEATSLHLEVGAECRGMRLKWVQSHPQTDDTDEGMLADKTLGASFQVPLHAARGTKTARFDLMMFGPPDSNAPASLAAYEIQQVLS